MPLPEYPPWLESEEEWTVRYLYRVTRSWAPSGTESVFKMVTRLAEVFHNEHPRSPPRSRVDIIQKIKELRADFHAFVRFIASPGIEYNRRRNTLFANEAYWRHIGDEDEEGRRSRRYRLYGMTMFEERRYLFAGGCFDCVDYNWLLASAAGVDPEWLGPPHAF